MLRLADARSAISAAWAGARFFSSFPRYLLRPVQLEAARRGVERGLLQREQALLDRIRHDVFGQPRSVYHQLFRHAGCELGDVEKLVHTTGVDAALRTLLRAGVYLTIDEFKGRMAVVRGRLSIDAVPEMLRSPRAAYHLPLRSGGSRSGGTPVLIDLRFVRDCAANCMVNFDVWDVLGGVTADWETPGAGARFRLSKFAMFGDVPAAWFSQVDPEDASLPAVMRWNTRALRYSSALAGRKLPYPGIATLNDPSPVVEWLHQQCANGQGPILFTFPGSAVRACLWAQEKGFNIAGTRFFLSGEPITQARVDTIRRAGCVVMPRYGSIECGAIGYGCANPACADDLHVLEHQHALVQAGESLAEFGPKTLFITNLHRYSPFLMLNVSMGDQADLAVRECGCKWQHLGLSTHVSNIRSFEKLTGGGVTFLGTEVITILENALPARFGGAPTDYQLVEEETPAGEPVLVLRVHPRVAGVDGVQVRDLFLEQLGRESTPAEVMARMWRDAGTVQVVREAPLMSGAGKILHLHVRRKPA